MNSNMLAGERKVQIVRLTKGSDSKTSWKSECEHERQRERLKMNWVGEVNEQLSDRAECRHRLSGTEGAGNRTTNRRTVGAPHREHRQIWYLHLRDPSSGISKWEEQKPSQQTCQPLMFSNCSNGGASSWGVSFCDCCSSEARPCPQ